MLPPLRTVKAALRRATETLAVELAQAQPGRPAPAWNELEWRLASAAAAAHGVSPLLYRYSSWQPSPWRQFLAEQREHVERRHQRIVDLLRQIDLSARIAGLAIVPLKGAALHALGLYAPGDRPMADIDLLVHENDVESTTELLRELGYLHSFTQWKHRVFKPAQGQPLPGLGEHRDTPINIELHTRIQERLPIARIDITQRIYPCRPEPGLNPYPSNGALMSHLLLHAAGNICGRSLRLLHLNDISLLATRMVASDWSVLWDSPTGSPPWWALPPLRLVDRYYHHAVPRVLLERLERETPALLRVLSRRNTLTKVSSSELWLHSFPGVEWCRSLHELRQYLTQRFAPTEEAIQERADMIRTQLWLQGQNWVTASRLRRMLTRLIHPVPRMDALYVVRAALETPTPPT